MFRSYLLTALLIVLTPTVGLCQKETDHVPLKSSLAKLRTAPEDTNKVSLLLNIGNELISILPNATDNMLAFYEKRPPWAGSCGLTPVLFNASKMHSPILSKARPWEENYDTTAVYYEV